MKSSFNKIAVADDRKIIYVADQDRSIFRYDAEKQAWVEPLKLENSTGTITDIAVNYRFLVVSATDGIWYRK